MKDVDVVVIGSGISGLAAALAANELGLQPVLIEKEALVGGGTAGSAGALWIGNTALARAAGFEDSREATLTYMRWVGDGDLDEGRLLAYVDRAPVALEFFTRCGVAFEVVPTLGDHYFTSGVPGSMRAGRIIEVEPISSHELGPWKDRVRQSLPFPEARTAELIGSGGVPNCAHWDPRLVAELAERRTRGAWGRGQGLVAHFLKQLLVRDVPIRLETVVTRLIRDGGRVIGVETADGERIAAKNGVVLTTGGYESDAALAMRYEGLPGWQSMFPAGLTGDALTLAGDVGAAVKVLRNNAALFLGFRKPATEQGDEPFQLASVEEMPCPHTIVVNRFGNRFADEAFFQHVVKALRHFDAPSHRYPNLPCFLIFDRQFAEKFGFAERPVGAPIPDWVQRADTLSELAGKLGVEAVNLGRTVERFNGFARAGRDLDFHRGEATWGADSAAWDENARGAANPRLGSVSVAPFYGLELHPSAFASAGLRADERARVLDVTGAPIPGLYASGNVAAHTEYGVGYQGGCSLASGMTFSHLAILDMVEAKLPTTAARA